MLIKKTLLKLGLLCRPRSPWEFRIIQLKTAFELLVQHFVKYTVTVYFTMLYNVCEWLGPSETHTIRLIACQLIIKGVEKSLKRKTIAVIGLKNKNRQVIPFYKCLICFEVFAYWRIRPRFSAKTYAQNYAKIMLSVRMQTRLHTHRPTIFLYPQLRRWKK